MFFTIAHFVNNILNPEVKKNNFTNLIIGSVLYIIFHSLLFAPNRSLHNYTDFFFWMLIIDVCVMNYFNFEEINKEIKKLEEKDIHINLETDAGSTLNDSKSGHRNEEEVKALMCNNSNLNQSSNLNIKQTNQSDNFDLTKEETSESETSDSSKEEITQKSKISSRVNTLSDINRKELKTNSSYIASEHDESNHFEQVLHEVAKQDDNISNLSE